MVPLYVTDGNERFCAALARADAHGVASVYADDALLLAPGSPEVNGRPAIEAFWKAGIAAGITRAELDTTVTHERGDLCVEVGRYRLELATPDGATKDAGKYVVVHCRDGEEKWSWAIDIFNSDRPSA